MAGATYKKRSRDEPSKSKAAPPLKKQKKQQAPSKNDQPDDEDEFQAVNLLDSDGDDIHNTQVDDGGDSGCDTDSTGSEDERPRSKKTKAARPQPIARDAPANSLAKDAPGSKKSSRPSLDDQLEDQSGDDDDEGENDEFSDLENDDLSGDDDGEGGENGEGSGANRAKLTSRSKRNDPEAFATSMSKILGTKISGKNRADPVLARSADARERVRAVVDEDLDRKARRKLREQKQRAMEKGRVRDVLLATNATFSNVNPVTGQVISDTDGATTAEVLATERRLRKVAQRGVVQLFNAFRTAQVKAAEAERVARKQGVIGMDRKKDKITEMSKKGFLDLIASGGGGLKKGPIEEA